jgi:hypothetical protein
MKTLCIYHGNCADGFGAAWAVRKALGSGVDFHAGVYQNAPPPIHPGQLVVLVDFSYKRAVMLDLLKQRPEAVLVLDHHKTAVEDLKADDCEIIDMTKFQGDLGWGRFLDNVAQDGIEGGPRIYTVFDLERSGAGIAWDFFHDATRPPLIDHIEDRDLWRFKLHGTREIQANVFSHPYDFDLWDVLMAADPNDLFREGEAIERKHHKDIAELTKVVTRPMKIGGYTVPMANLPYTLTSDAGNLLCGEVDAPPGVGAPSTSRYPFAGCYWDTPEGRVFSLRSRDDGLDVGEIAKQYGGGGHAHASGFRIPFDQLSQFEP